MRTQSTLVGICTIFMFSFSLSVQAAPPTEGLPDACALLQPGDLKSLLGGTPSAESKPGSCIWAVSGNTNKFVANISPQTGMSAEMTFARARKVATKDAGFSNETNLGDSAFSRLAPFGAVMLIIKQGKMLQLQYRTEAAGTDKDRDALRAVAQKAIATF